MTFHPAVDTGALMATALVPTDMPDWAWQRGGPLVSGDAEQRSAMFSPAPSRYCWTS